MKIKKANKIVENISLRSYNDMMSYLAREAFGASADVLQIEEEGRGYVIHSIATTTDTTALAIIGTPSESELTAILRDFYAEVSDVKFEVWEVSQDRKEGEDVTAIFGVEAGLEKFSL